MKCNYANSEVRNSISSLAIIIEGAEILLLTEFMLKDSIIFFPILSLCPPKILVCSKLGTRPQRAEANDNGVKRVCRSFWNFHVVLAESVVDAPARLSYVLFPTPQRNKITFWSSHGRNLLTRLTVHPWSFLLEFTLRSIRQQNTTLTFYLEAMAFSQYAEVRTYGITAKRSRLLLLVVVFCHWWPRRNLYRVDFRGSAG